MSSSGALGAKPLRRTGEKNWRRRTCVRTRDQRFEIRLNDDESVALDFLAQRWAANRSHVVRSLIVGATLGELDREPEPEPAPKDIPDDLDALLARSAEPIGEDPLADSD